MSGLSLSGENLGVLRDLLLSEKAHSVILNFIECLENTSEINCAIENQANAGVGANIITEESIEDSIVNRRFEKVKHVQIDRPKRKKKPKQRPSKQKKYEPITSFGYKFGEPNPHFTLTDSAKCNRAKLIQTSTKSEREFIGFLKSEGIKYEFQKIFYYDSSYYIVDFYIPSAKLVVEVDGRYHDSSIQQRDDLLRTRRLKSICGVNELIRFANEELKNRDFVVSRLCEYIEKYENIK